MTNITQYQTLLLQEYKTALKDLSPEYSEEANLAWLWGSFSQIEPLTPELQSGLCQLALHFGRSALAIPDVDYVLADQNLNVQDKLEHITAVLQPG